MILKFNKTQESRWYIDLPKWSGDLAELEMVAGADLLLDLLSGFSKPCVELEISTEGLPECGCLILISVGEDLQYDGAYYALANTRLGVTTEFNIWLCPVTLFVLGEYPQQIFFRSI